MRRQHQTLGGYFKKKRKLQKKRIAKLLSLEDFVHMQHHRHKKKSSQSPGE